MPTAFRNRLSKNARHFRRWAERQHLSAYRVYDRDVPDFPYVVERYGALVHLVEYPRRAERREGGDSQREAVLQDVVEVLEVPPADVFTKTHLPQPWGRSQYPRLAASGRDVTVEEQGLRFWVNLADRVDTGLFLDHRLTRARVRSEAKGKRVLNLFSYTAALSVYAAAGGAQSTTSVDLSNTYLDWTARNLELNSLLSAKHTLLRADALRWLSDAATHTARWDLVVLDPPPFSTSNAMRGTFDVQKDHLRMLRNALTLLTPSGKLYFSTNYRRFQLDERAPALGNFRELTPGILPPDVQRTDVLRCWEVQPPPGGVRESDESKRPSPFGRRPAPASR